MERTAASTSSTDDKLVALGRVVGAHGLDGLVRVRCFGGDPNNLLQVPSVRLGDGEGDASPPIYPVVNAAPGRSGEVRMTLAGVDDRDAAESLRGRLVLADEAHLGELPEGEYYSYQLVGCRVVGDDGREVGTVQEIWSTGAPDVLVVEDDHGEQHLIPAAESLLRAVDIEAGRIVIEILPGLLGDDDGAGPTNRGQ